MKFELLNVKTIGSPKFTEYKKSLLQLVVITTGIVDCPYEGKFLSFDRVTFTISASLSAVNTQKEIEAQAKSYISENYPDIP